MRKLSKILAVLLTVCLLCGVIATLVSATGETYTHPTLTATGATNYTSLNYESDGNAPVGNDKTGNKNIVFSRFYGNAAAVGTTAIPGTSQTNSYLLIESPSNADNAFDATGKPANENTSYANMQSQYIQFMYTNYGGRPTSNFFGTNSNGVTSEYKYFVFDMDFAAMGYEVTLVDGTVIGATKVVTNYDGSTTATLTDGSLLTTSKDGKTTTQVNTDGSKLVTVTGTEDGKDITTVTEYNAEGAVVTVTKTVKNEDGSYSKTVCEENDTLIRSVERTAVAADGSYTLTVTDREGNTTTVAYTVSGSRTAEGTCTETLNINGDEKVYTSVYTIVKRNYGLQVINMTQKLELTDVIYNNAYYVIKSSANDSGYGGTTSVEYANYSEEFDSYLSAMTDADVSGAHISSYRLAYSDSLQMMHTMRLDGSSWGSLNIGMVLNYQNGEWVLTPYVAGKALDGTTIAKGTTVATLSDKAGEWNHLTTLLAVDETNPLTASKLYFLLDGEVIYVYEFNVASTYTAVYFEDLRVSDYDVMQNNYHRYAFDNVTENMYTTGDNGIATLVSNLANQTTSSLIGSTNTVYNESYITANNSYVQIGNGEKIYNKSFAKAELAKVTDGATVTATMNIKGATLPDGVKSITVLCDTDEVSVSFTNARTFTMKDGYYVLANSSLQTTDTSSSRKNDNQYHDFENKTVGNSANVDRMDVNNTATTYAPFTVRQNGDNLYASWRWSKASTSRYRIGIPLASSINNSYANGSRVSDYSYFTVDFDLAADMYVYTLDGEEHLAESLDEIPQSATDVKLAYSPTTNLSLDVRGKQTDGASDWVGGYTSTNVTFKYENDGKWHIYTGKGTENNEDTGYTLSDTLGEWNHFTFAVKVIKTDFTNSNGEQQTTYGYSEVFLYYNGNLIRRAYINNTLEYGAAQINSATSNINVCTDMNPYYIIWYNCVGGTYTDHKFSMALDNFATNYYATDYESEGSTGIDDLFTDSSVKLADCTDTVYHNYVYPAPNGYVQLNADDPVFFTGFDSVLDELTTGDTLYVNSANVTLTPNDTVDNFTVWCYDGATFTVNSANHLVVDNKNGSYTVRKPAENEIVRFTVVDPAGNVIAPEQTLLPNTTVTLPDGYFDPATGNYIHVGKANWIFNMIVDAEDYQNVYDDKGTNGFYFTAQEMADGMINKTVTVTYVKNEDETADEADKYSETLLTTFAVYYTDSIGFTQLVGSVSDYSTTENFVTKVNAAPDNATVILYADRIDITTLDSSCIYLQKNYTLNVDINGKKLVQSGLEGWGNIIFNLNQGSHLNLYSSKPGGEIYQVTNNKTDNVTGTEAANACSKSGIVSVNANQNYDGCSANIGAFGDIPGDNLSCYGATLFTSYSKILTKGGAESDENKIVINVNGGYYYSVLDISGGMFTVKAPDTEFNVTGAKLFFKNSNAGIVYLYTNNYNCENSSMTIKDSQLIAIDSAGTGVGNITSSMNDSTFKLNIEGCTFCGKIGMANGTLTLGKNNVIATDGVVKYPYTSAHHADGVASAGNNNSANTATWSFTLPSVFMNGFANVFEKDEAGTYTYVISDAQLAARETYTYTKTVDLITYLETETPANVKTLTWKNLNGEQYAGKTPQNWTVGSTIAFPTLKDNVVNDWFTVKYRWVYEGTSTTAANTVIDGDNAFEVKDDYYGILRNTKANVSLFTDMTFNLYLPIVADGSITNVTVDGVTPVTTTLDDGKEYYVLSHKLSTEDLAGKSVTVSFKYNSIEKTATVSLDVVKYASLVLDKYDCGTAEAKLMYAMMDYKYEAAKYAKGDSFTATEAYTELMNKFAAHGDTCTCKNISVIPTEAEKNATLAPITAITGVAYTVTTGDVGMFIETEATFTSLTVSYIGTDGKTVTKTVGNGIEKRTGGYLVTGISASDLDNIMTVTADGTTGTCSLGAYLQNESAPVVATALYNYAKAAEAYKTATAD